MVAQGKILILDDEEVIREVVARSLTHFGVGEPVKTATVAEAIKAVEGGDVRAAVVDLVLQGESGHAFLAFLVERGLNLPVVVVSGRAETDDIIMLLRNRVYNFLPKPFSIPDLITALQEVMAKAPSPKPRRETTSFSPQDLKPKP